MPGIIVNVTVGMGHGTLGSALQEHLSRSGLPSDGGDSEAFAVVKIGPMPYPIPNTKSRKRAVKIHDLNHLVTGFKTDREGELEISAWELASGGCANYGAAWVLDLVGMFSGLFICPRRTVRAFLLGREQQNLYRYQLDELLALPVAEAQVRISDSAQRVRVPAVVQLTALGLVALPLAVLMTAMWWVVTPLWLLSKFRARTAGPSIS
jgi:hypothetical protein